MELYLIWALLNLKDLLNRFSQPQSSGMLLLAWAWLLSELIPIPARGVCESSNLHELLTVVTRTLGCFTFHHSQSRRLLMPREELGCGREARFPSWNIHSFLLPKAESSSKVFHRPERGLLSHVF